MKATDYKKRFNDLVGRLQKILEEDTWKAEGYHYEGVFAVEAEILKELLLDSVFPDFQPKAQELLEKRLNDHDVSILRRASKNPCTRASMTQIRKLKGIGVVSAESEFYPGNLTLLGLAVLREMESSR